MIWVDKKSQKIGFVGQIKKLDNHGYTKDSGANQNVFVLTFFLKKIKETRLKLS